MDPAPSPAYTSAERCGPRCTIHLHGDPRLGVPACGSCAVHVACASHLGACASCRLPIGQLNTAIFSECNVNRCRAPAAVVCRGCLRALVKRFEKHMAVMATLSTESCDGWLRTNGGLRDRENKVVVTVVLDELIAEAVDGVVVRRTTGGVEHFSETVNRAAGAVTVPTPYADLVRLVPGMQVDAAAVLLRRFVAERRRHWQEVPGRRAVVSIGVEAAPSVSALLWKSTTLLDPGRLVTMAPGAARDQLHSRCVCS